MKFAQVVAQLPNINGHSVISLPLPYDEIVNSRADIHLASLPPEASRALTERVSAPRRELTEYRLAFDETRRELVRPHLDRVIEQIDSILDATHVEDENARSFTGGGSWDKLRQSVAELDRLIGAALPAGSRHTDLLRHLRFAEPQDLRDIVEADWPKVRAAVLGYAFSDVPRPVDVEDLAELVGVRRDSAAIGSVDWASLDDDAFERLIFQLLLATESYENVELLMKTHAPDRARDISADRVHVDELSGTRRRHVLVQCKHWATRSLNVSDVVEVLEKAKLWAKPFTVVVVATSGMFSQDAVDWREQRELKDKSPHVEFWNGPHLEQLLARRPAVRGQFF